MAADRVKQDRKVDKQEEREMDRGREERTREVSEVVEDVEVKVEGDCLSLQSTGRPGL